MTIDLENGEGGGGEKRRGPGRPKKSETTADLERDMREQLEELGAWVKVRDPELAETFLEDAAKMAKFLATRAGKNERLAKMLGVFFAKDGPLAGLRAFGRTARTVLARVNARRAAAEAEEEAGEWIDDAGNRRDAQGNVIVPGA